MVQSVGLSRENTRDVTDSISRLQQEYRGLTHRLDSDMAASRHSQEAVLAKLAQNTKKIEQTAEETKTIREMIELAGIHSVGDPDSRSSPPLAVRGMRARPYSADRAVRRGRRREHSRSGSDSGDARSSSIGNRSRRRAKRASISDMPSDFSSRLGDSIEKYFNKIKREPVEMRNVER